MAVLQSLPGIEVFVCVKGEALEEYDDDEAQADVESGETNQYQASKTVSKYIESVTDQEFAIKLLVGNPYYFDCGSLGFSIRVDGRKVRSPLLRRDEYSSVNGWSQDVRGIRAEEGEKSLIRPFKFAEIKKSKYRNCCFPFGQHSNTVKLLMTINSMRLKRMQMHLNRLEILKSGCTASPRVLRLIPARESLWQQTMRWQFMRGL